MRRALLVAVALGAVLGIVVLKRILGWDDPKPLPNVDWTGW